MNENNDFICPSNSKLDCVGCPQEHNTHGCTGKMGTPAGSINALACEVHETAVANGWWASSPDFPAVIALCHSELSEALEAYRNGEDSDVINYTFDGCGDVIKDECAGCFGDAPKCGIAKPNGVPVELADCIMRILDYCGYAGIDIDTAIREKIRHNKTRPYRHGGKVV